MSANAVVRARIDEHIKEEATVVLAAMGLTVSDAFRIMLTRVAREKALPFEPLIPNATTIEAKLKALAARGFRHVPCPARKRMARKPGPTTRSTIQPMGSREGLIRGRTKISSMTISSPARSSRWRTRPVIPRRLAT